MLQHFDTSHVLQLFGGALGSFCMCNGISGLVYNSGVIC